MEFIICILIGYGIGIINPSYILGKIKGIDIREIGSHNAGASNALIVLGKVKGVACAIFDISKVILAIWISKCIFPNFQYAFAFAGVAGVLGHMFPFYMGFRGGKGTATLAGLVLAYDVRVFLIMLVSGIAIVLISDYLCFLPISASVVFPIVFGILENDLTGALIISVSTIAILLKNIENIIKIVRGTELHFSFLWNKDKELERITENEKKHNKLK